MTLAQLTALIEAENELHAPSSNGGAPLARPERGTLADLRGLASMASGAA